MGKGEQDACAVAVAAIIVAAIVIAGSVVYALSQQVQILKQIRGVECSTSQTCTAYNY